MRLYTFIVNNVASRRVAALLAIIGMAIAIGTVVALHGISKRFDESFQAIYKKQNVDLIVQRAGAKQKPSPMLPETLGPKIEAIPGVAQVNPALVDLIPLEGTGPVGVMIQGWIPDAQGMQKLTILEGGRFSAQQKQAVMLGKDLAEKLKKKIGDELTIYEGAPPFEVVGIYRGTSVHEDGNMIVPLKTLQERMSKEGMVNGFTVKLKHSGDDKEIERVRAAIEKLSSEVEVIATKKVVKSAPAAD